jgi:beta-lactam-binding protein with PASTA domain
MSAERMPGASEFADQASEDATLSDEDWPVDARYVVEPVPAPVQAERDSLGRDQLGGAVRAERRFRAQFVLLAVLLLALALALSLALSLAARIATRQNTGEATPPSPPARTSSGAGGQTTMSSPTGTTAAVPVPDVTGLQLPDATARLTDAGFHVRVLRETSHAPETQVLRQSPEASTKVPKKSFVTLTVSTGVKDVQVPQLVGLSASDADQQLHALGLRHQVHLVRSSGPAGTVLDQSPAAGSRAAPQSAVVLEVAKRAPTPVTIAVPSVVGLTATTARGKLAAAGLHAAGTQVSSDQPEHTVVRQSPGAGTRVKKGATVTISVSSGPAQVTVPSIVGLDEQSARDRLEAAGFVVRVVGEATSDPGQDGMVTAQDPSGGSKATDGATVVLTVAHLT